MYFCTPCTTKIYWWHNDQHKKYTNLPMAQGSVWKQLMESTWNHFLPALCLFLLPGGLPLLRGAAFSAGGVGCLASEPRRACFTAGIELPRSSVSEKSA